MERETHTKREREREREIEREGMSAHKQDTSAFLSKEFYISDGVYMDCRRMCFRCKGVCVGV